MKWNGGRKWEGGNGEGEEVYGEREEVFWDGEEGKRGTGEDYVRGNQFHFHISFVVLKVH